MVVAASVGVLSVVLVTGLWPASQPRTKVTQLTNDAFEKFPFLAAEGGRILYSARLHGNWELRSVSTGGGEPQNQRSPCIGDKEDAIILGTSRYHRQILVGCASGLPDLELWLVGFDGDNRQSIGRARADYGISISPDMRTLLLSRKEGLFVRPIDGGEERPLAHVEWSSASYPFWHPSGERIGFFQSAGETPGLREVRADGSGIRPLLPGFMGEQNSGQWSPDGNRLYFVSEKEIYVQGTRQWLGWMRKSVPVRLTSGAIQFSVPFEHPANSLTVYAWGQVLVGELMKLNRKTGVFEPYLDGLSADCLDYSPDGQWIAYSDFPGGALWTSKRDGTGRVLLEDSLLVYNPRWSPDGTRIAFAGRKTGQSFRIYTIPARGGRSIPVPGVRGAAFDPTWSPDGKQLVFAPFYLESERKDQHVSIGNLETRKVRMVPGSEGMFSSRWSPDGNWLVALSSDRIEPFVYSFKAGTWEKLVTGRLGFPRWTKDSRYVYGQTVAGLVRVAVATRKVELIREVKEFNVLGLLSPGSWWTPEDELVVLKDNSTSQIYRIDRDR